MAQQVLLDIFVPLQDAIVRRIQQEKDITYEDAIGVYNDYGVDGKVDRMSFSVNSPDYDMISEALCGKVTCHKLEGFERFSADPNIKTLQELSEKFNYYFTTVAHQQANSPQFQYTLSNVESSAVINIINNLKVNAGEKEDTAWWNWYISTTITDANQVLCVPLIRPVSSADAPHNTMSRFMYGLTQYMANANNMIPQGFLISELRKILVPANTSLQDDLTSFINRCKQLDGTFLIKCGLENNFAIGAQQTPKPEFFAYKATFGFSGLKQYMVYIVTLLEYRYVIRSVSAKITLTDTINVPEFTTYLRNNIANVNQDIKDPNVYKSIEDAVMAGDVATLARIAGIENNETVIRSLGIKITELQKIFKSVRTTNFPPFQYLREHFKSIDKTSNVNIWKAWFVLMNSDEVKNRPGISDVRPLINELFCNSAPACYNNSTYIALKDLGADLRDTNKHMDILAELRTTKILLATIVILMTLCMYNQIRNYVPALDLLSLYLVGIILCIVIFIYVFIYINRINS